MTDFVALKRRRDAPKDTIQAVRRAARLLQAIASASSPPTAAELARMLDLNVSTCYHLLNTLEVEALVARGDDARYILGPQLLFLAGRLSEGALELTQLIGELEELNSRSHETSYLVAWHGDHISVLAARIGHEPVVVGDIQLGYREHAHAKASGKAILAFSSKEEVDRYLRDHPTPALTPRTVVDPAVLRAQLEEIRSRGFAEEIEEYAIGVACLASPILAPAGKVVGALAISTPIDRFQERREFLIGEVVRAGRRASSALGFR